MGRFIKTGVGDISVQQSQFHLFYSSRILFFGGKETIHPPRCGSVFVFIYVFIVGRV